MKMMDTFLLLHAEAPAMVAARPEILVDHLTNVTVLHLYLITELHRGGRDIRLQRVLMEVPFEDRYAALRRDRQHDIQRRIVGITIQHPIWIHPVILRRQITFRL